MFVLVSQQIISIRNKWLPWTIPGLCPGTDYGYIVPLADINYGPFRTFFKDTPEDNLSVLCIIFALIFTTINLFC